MLCQVINSFNKWIVLLWVRVKLNIQIPLSFNTTHNLYELPPSKPITLFIMIFLKKNYDDAAKKLRKEEEKRKTKER